MRIVTLLVSSLLLLTPAAPAAPARPIIKLATITAVSALGTELVIVTGTGTYLAAAASVTLEGDAIVLGGAYLAMESGGPVFKAEYFDNDGIKRTVEMDCTGMSLDPCFRRFTDAETLMRKRFPEAPTSKPVK